MKTRLLSLAVAAFLSVHAGQALAQDEKGLSPAVVQQLDLINRDILARAKALSVGRQDLLTMADDIGGTKAKGGSWRIDAVKGRSSYKC